MPNFPVPAIDPSTNLFASKAVMEALAGALSAVTSVRRFGAFGDGVTDDTEAVQAAIDEGGLTYFPPGTYIVSNLRAVNGMHLLGAGTAGTGRSRLRARTGNIFRTGPTATFGTKVSGLVFDSYGGGGDLFTGLWSLGQFEDCSFVQYQDNASCFNVTGWIDMLTIRCTWDHTHTAKVPTFKAVSDVGELAQSSFISSRFTRTGDYAIHLEGTQGSVVENFTIRDTNFEEPKGGAIRLLSARNTMIEAPGMWDFHDGGARKHLIRIGASAVNGAVSSNNEIRHYVRDASEVPIPDVYDILVENGTTMTSIIHSRHQINGRVLIDMGSTTGLVVGDNHVFNRGDYVTVVGGSFLRPPALSSASRPSASTVGAGAMVYDTTTKKPVWSDGITWREAGGAAV